MTDVHEKLSRLLDGDLPPAEAAALRARIAAEPEVAAAWHAVQGLGAELSDLPDPPPSARLDELVLAPARPPAPARWPRWPLLAVSVVAAAAVLLVALPRPRPELQLVDGSQWVDGHARVHAAESWVDVDGRALVTVEPRGGPVRVTAQEDPMSVSSHLAAAVAGAAVTVAVYQGVAHIHASGKDVVVHAGETLTVGNTTPPAAEKPTPKVVTVYEPAPPAPADAQTDPQKKIAALKAEVAQLKFEKGLMHGELAVARGTPEPWPDQVAPIYAPDTYTKRVKDALASTRLGDLVKMDCSEYPCIAYVDVDPSLDASAMQGAMSTVLDDVRDGQDTSAMQMVMKSQGEDGTESSLMAMAIFPKGSNDDVQKRAQYRAQTYASDYQHGATQ